MNFAALRHARIIQGFDCLSANESSNNQKLVEHRILWLYTDTGIVRRCENQLPGFLLISAGLELDII